MKGSVKINKNKRRKRKRRREKGEKGDGARREPEVPRDNCLAGANGVIKR